MRSRYLAVLSISLAACSSNPPPAASPSPAPVPATTTPPPATATTPAAAPVSGTRDLSGSWDFSVDAGGQTIPGEITLTRSGTSYTGTVVPQGLPSSTVRSATITGDRVAMLIDSSDGEVSVDAVLSADGRSMSGTVLFQGQSLGFSARKR